jgi:hypothetical protein
VQRGCLRRPPAAGHIGGEGRRRSLVITQLRRRTSGSRTPDASDDERAKPVPTEADLIRLSPRLAGGAFDLCETSRTRRT